MAIQKKTGDDLRGLIIPDRRITYLATYNEADSVLTQASPRPGVPEPLADSDMMLETSGAQSADKDMRIIGHMPGHVDDESARFHWKHTTGTDTNVKGWNPPNTGFRGVEIVSETEVNSTSGLRLHRLDIITLADGSMVACGGGGSGGSSAGVRVWYKRVEDTYWSDASGGTGDPDGINVRTDWLGATTSSNPRVAGGTLVELPSGRVLHLFWAAQATDTGGNGSVYNIRCHKSDDRGVTWTNHAMDCLSVPLTSSTTAGSLEAYAPGQLKAAYKDGQILLISSVVIKSADAESVLSTGTWTGSTRFAGNTWMQMASSDLGATFDRVETGNGEPGQNGTGFCVAVVNGEFVISYIRNARNSSGIGTDDYPIGDIAVIRLGSAFQLMSNATVYSFKNAHRTYALTGDQDGSIDDSHISGDWPGHNADPQIYDWEMALCASPEGNLYLGVVGFGEKRNVETGARTGGSENQWNIARLFISSDAGETWQDPGRSWFDATTVDNAPELQTWAGYAALPDTSPRGGEFYNAGGTFTYGATRSFSRLRHIAFTWTRGQLVCIAKGQGTFYTLQGATTEQVQQRVFTMHLGGYSDLLRGHNLHPVDDGDRGNLRIHYVPFELPIPTTVAGSSFWTVSETGPNTSSIIWSAPNVNNKPRLEITTGDGAGVAGQQFYAADTDEILQREVGVGTSHDHIVEMDFALHVYAADSPLTGDAVGVQIVNGVLTSSGTTARAQLNIGFDTTRIVCYDFWGGAVVANVTLASAGLAYPIQVRVRCGAGPEPWAVWASNYEPTATVRKWVLIGSGTDAVNPLTVNTGSERANVKWGHHTATGSATQNKSDWFFVQCGSCEDDINTGGPHKSGWTLTDNLAEPDDIDQYYAGARRVSSVPVYVDDGVYLAGKDGPLVRSNQWQVKTRYDYGIENIHHEINASPDSTWRSTSAAAQCEIVWHVGPASTDGGYSLNRVYGVYLGNINFRTAYLDVQADGSTSWTQVAEIDAADGMTGLAFERKGNSVRPHANANAAGQYFTYNLLAGSHIALDTGGSPAIRPIETNSEGVFSGATGKRTVIRIDGDLTGLSAGGSSVLCDIWSKEATALFHQMDTAHKIRLRIPAQTTYEGYFEIGSFIAGSVAVFGRQHSRGSMREIQTNTDIATQRSGTRRASVHGKSRRSAELSWSDSVDISGLQSAAPAPDYVSTMYGSLGSDPHHAHGTYNDGPTLIQGLIEGLDGASVPVVYLPRIPATNFDGGVVTTKIADRNRMLMGRIVSTKYRVENVLGSDGLDEVVTGTTIRIDEEL